MASSSSSSSSIILQATHDVFLSFRGEDTRDNFTSHLYAALCRKQIQTFIDDDGLKRGDDISPALLDAIEESKISVIIFSKDYASSKWCLDELEKILQCKKVNGQMVIPVFHQVSPSDVRKQTGSFGEAFVRHEQNFKDMTEKVQKWRDALTEAANLSGWDSMKIRPESKLVDEIVKDILQKLNDLSPSNDCEGLVGIEAHVEQIKSLLCIGLSDFQVLGIWGMGGIGKTTIAEVVFNQISNQFEGCCFIANVRDESTKRGLVHLKEHLLAKILEENINIGTLNNVPTSIQHRVLRRKVFIVLDDVNDLEQLEILIGRLPRFGWGSRVIITTRDKQILCAFRVKNIYHVKELNHGNAFQLFCNHAFEQNLPPPAGLIELSWRIIDYAQGNPLALKVLGSALYQKSKQEWESAVYKLKKIFNPKIHDLLVISYNELDVEEQNIFLDIACFFKGWNINHVTRLLDSCYNSLHFGLSVLIDKSLISITMNNIQMHDLLQEMGWEIVRQESPKVPGKRSRLWNHEDVLQVLKNNKGTDAIEGLFLDLSKTTDMYISSEAFENMPNLKFLNFYLPPFVDGLNISRVHLPQGLKYISHELRYLHWHGYPLKTLPSNFSPKNLIELSLPHSSYDQLWVERKHGSDLKLIDLNPSDTPQLERCLSLLETPPYMQFLSSLRILNMRGCKSLRSFPSHVHFESLITLNLSYCSNLTKFPEISGNIKELLLFKTAIEEVPSSIASLNELVKLDLWECTRLTSVSTSIYNLKSLCDFNLSDCRIELSHLHSFACWKDVTFLFLGFCNLTKIPEDLCCLSSLGSLDLSGNNFESLPTGINQLSQLRRLFLRDCNMLQSIPELPRGLESLDATNCGQLQSLAEFPLNLKELDESELEIVFKYSNKYSVHGVHFIFTNCFKLNKDNSLIDSQQRIQHMASAALRSCYDKVFDAIRPINLCLPGSEIPDWFSHQSLGSSITIDELPKHCCKTRLIGFALSAVVVIEKSYYDDVISIMGYSGIIGIKCYCNIQDNFFLWSSYVGRKDMSIDSDHIFIGYSPMDVSLLEGDYLTSTFDFEMFITKGSFSFDFETLISNEPFSTEASEGLKVKCYGVCPLYVQSNTSIERSAGDIEVLAETMLADDAEGKSHDVNTSSSECGRSEDEGVEPQSKKIHYKNPLLL